MVRSAPSRSAFTSSRRFAATGATVVLVAAVLLAGCGKEERKPVHARTDGAAPGVAVSQDDPRWQDLGFLRRQAPSSAIDLAIGKIYLERGATDSALVFFRRAVEADDTNAAAWNYLGIGLARAGDLAESKKAYLKAIDLDTLYPKTHINLGNVYFREGELDKAIAAYKVATSIDSTDAVAWKNLALAHRKDGSINLAILAFNKVAECDPADPSPWEQLGNIYYERKLFKAARQRWGEAVARDPSRDDLREAIRVLQAYADSTDTP